MKFLISTIQICLLGFALGLFFPWWTIAVAAFIVPLFIYQSPLRSFLTGFLGIFAFWLLLTITINSSNHSILASKIAFVLPLGGSVPALILITAFIGGLIGGFAALSSSYLSAKRRAHNIS